MMDATTRKRHPIRGFLGGLLLGLGATLLLLTYAIVPFGKLTPWIVLGLSIVVGVVIGVAGPARRKTA